MKVALVYAGQKPKWVSARSIRENLRKVWLGVEDAHVIDFPYIKKQNWPTWEKALQETKPDLIVFLESMPVPVDAVLAIYRIKSMKRVPIIFHLYGDFSINTHKWFWLGRLLVGRPVLWLAASAAQKGQISQFFKAGVDVRCLPFPVDCELYHPFEAQEDSESGHRFLYAGRFSRQKNTMLLLEWASEYLEKNPSVSFDFAGPFDDIGARLWGQKDLRGSTLARWSATLDSLSEDVRARIRYHGILAPEKLRALAAKTDCYVSLSTFHDEDFGMAPLESLFCGSRAILSGWGGYSSFAVDRDSVKIIKVGIKKDSLTINKNNFFKALDNVIAKKKVSMEDRYQRHLIFSSHFGIASLSESLKKILNRPIKNFTGFNYFMQVHGNLILEHWMEGKKVYKHPGTADPIYERVYRSYRKAD